MTFCGNNYTLLENKGIDRIAILPVNHIIQNLGLV